MNLNIPNMPFGYRPIEDDEIVVRGDKCAQANQTWVVIDSADCLGKTGKYVKEKWGTHFFITPRPPKTPEPIFNTRILAKEKIEGFCDPWPEGEAVCTSGYVKYGGEYEQDDFDDEEDEEFQ